jgi:thymidylate kinase
MDLIQERRVPTLVSFSGIDGAGKSTQIASLAEELAEARIDFLMLTFWDDVAAFSGLRESGSQALFKGDKGIGTPSKPVNRRDKNVRSWPVAFMRFVLYLFDAISLALVVGKAKTRTTGVIIFDRYIYDELANLPLNRWASSAYIRFLLKFVPKPDIAYLIDADPVSARARKPEYPLDFLQHNRADYLAISDFAQMKVIAPSTPGEMHRNVMDALMSKLLDCQNEQVSTASPVES